MQLRPLDPKLVTARMAIIIAGTILLAVNFFLFPVKTGTILYLFLFSLAILLADLMVIEIPQEGTITASVAIILTAVFLGPDKMPLAVTILAIFLGTTTGAFIKKKFNLSMGIIFSKRIAAANAAALSLYLWFRFFNNGNDFWSHLAVSIITTFTYFIVSTAIEALLFSLEKGASLRMTFAGRARLLAFVYFTFAIVSLLMAMMFKWMDFWSILIFSLPLAVTGQSFKLYLDIRKTYTSTIKALTATIEAVDSKREGHAQRVADYCLAIGRELGFYGSRLEKLHFAAILHDIGKLGIEAEKIKKITTDIKNIPFHAQIGSDIINQVTHLQDVSSIIKYHHYRFENMPKDLPLESRIIQVADAFDILTANTGLGSARAIRKIRAEKGLVYDPRVIRAFTSILRRQKKTAVNRQLRYA